MLLPRRLIGMADRTGRELYKYLRRKDRERRPRLWPWALLAVLVLALLFLLSRTRILIVI